MSEHASPGRPILEWTYTYQDLCHLTGKSLNTVQASKRRPGGFGRFDRETTALVGDGG